MDAALRAALKSAEISSVSGSGQHAAVALILAGPRNELVFIRRAVDPRDPWSGQIALPGGRLEPSDGQLLSTAIRETKEEVGISLEPEDCLGQLPRVRARSRSTVDSLFVTPFVFRIGDAIPTTTLNHEVAETIWLPLLDLLDPTRQAVVEFNHEGLQRKFPAVQLGAHRLWGLTYSIVSSLVEMVIAERADSPH